MMNKRQELEVERLELDLKNLRFNLAKSENSLNNLDAYPNEEDDREFYIKEEIEYFKLDIREKQLFIDELKIL